MNKISFTSVGEIMLGRNIYRQYSFHHQSLITKELNSILEKPDFVLGNLEAPISETKEDQNDLMNFVAPPIMLKEISCINALSLANNHINDAGTQGIEESIFNIEQNKKEWNGFFFKKDYTPLIVSKGNQKIAVICCTDILNREIDKQYNKHLLWLSDSLVNDTISKYKKLGYFVLLYVHGGIMFSRFPNPMFRKELHEKIDVGADCIITVHPHVLGGMEIYNNKHIFYSLGDFIMDGESERRREAGILNLEIAQSQLQKWELIPTFINKDLRTILPSRKRYDKIMRSWNFVSKSMKKNSSDYERFYKKQYKKEILIHSFSTIYFQLKYKGIFSLIKLIFSRFKDFKNMARWAMKDTSKMKNNLEDKSML